MEHVSGFWRRDKRRGVIHLAPAALPWSTLSEIDREQGIPVESFLELIHPNDQGRVRGEVARTHPQNVGAIRYRVRGADGAWRLLCCQYWDLSETERVGTLAVVPRETLQIAVEGDPINQIADRLLAARAMAGRVHDPMMIYTIDIALTQLAHSAQFPYIPRG